MVKDEQIRDAQRLADRLVAYERRKQKAVRWVVFLAVGSLMMIAAGVWMVALGI